MRSADGIGSFELQDLERLERVLGAFVAETRLRCALLIDRNGRHSSTTQGLVRAKTRAVVPELARLLDELVEREPAVQGIEAAWLEEAHDEIDRLFAD